MQFGTDFFSFQNDCINNIDNKLQVLIEECAAMNIELKNVVYMGNDVNDIPCIINAGLGIAVADSHPRVLKAADFVTNSKGGNGAIREVCDLFDH